MIYVFVGEKSQDTVSAIAATFGEGEAIPVNLVYTDGMRATNFVWRGQDLLLTTTAPADLENENLRSILAITKNSHPNAVVAISTTTDPERVAYLLRHFAFEIYRVTKDVTLDEIVDSIADEHNLSRMERFHG